MACNRFEVKACLEEGNSSIVSYDLEAITGTEIIAVDKLEYSVSDGQTTLVDWTEITNPDLPSGNFLISSSVNRIDQTTTRYVTIHVNFDATERDAFQTVQYELTNSPNTTTTTP